MPWLGQKVESLEGVMSIRIHSFFQMDFRKPSSQFQNAGLWITRIGLSLFAWVLPDPGCCPPYTKEVSLKHRDACRLCVTSTAVAPHSPGNKVQTA